jgi:formate dehydrogenase iron-sulfur subunit
MIACPFYIPKYEWESAVPWVRKCQFCSTRLQAGLKPACVGVCPTKSMFFGERDDVMAEAKRRITTHPEKYVDHIYGEKEAGGTSWLYISGVQFDTLGFNMNVTNQKLPDLTWAYISKIPSVIGVVLTAGALGWAITRRNQHMDKEE